MAICKSITRLLPAAFVWLLLFIPTTLFFIFPCQYLQKEYHFSITIVQAIITLFVFTNFLLTTFMDPGVIPKASREEDDDDFRAPLYKNAEVNGITIRMKWCVTCKFYRPPRCSHCSVCNTCIETFDHHCPWINNCIGRRNYRHFFFFLVFLSFHMITIFVWCILYILNHKEMLRDTESVVALVLIGLIILLIIPIIGLTLFHTILVSKGRTTNEQVTRKFQDNFNPFSRGCILNWCYILCGPSYPKYKISRKTFDFFESSEKTSLNEGSSNDKIVKVYLDNEDKSINGKNLSAQFILSKNNDLKKSNSNFNDLILNNVDKIDLVLESQSRDCQPSPPASTQNLDWQKNRLINGQSRTGNLPSFNSYSNSKSYLYNPGPTQLTSSQSQVLYTQHFPLSIRKTENGKIDNVNNIGTNFQQKQPENIFDSTNLALSNKTNSNQAQPVHHYYYQYKTRPISPAKSTSISEISPYAHQNNYNLKQTSKPSNIQHSGVVVYYSPEEASSSLMITDLDNAGKFASETELQRLKEHLISSPEKVNNKNNYFSKRPMSFMKALEITDKIERNSSWVSNLNKSTTNKNLLPENENLDKSNNSKEDSRHGQYGINYEISV